IIFGGVHNVRSRLTRSLQRTRRDYNWSEEEFDSATGRNPEYPSCHEWEEDYNLMSWSHFSRAVHHLRDGFNVTVPDPQILRDISCYISHYPGEIDCAVKRWQMV